MTSRPVPDAQALLADQRWLAGLARGLVGDEQSVEDVLQETHLRAWRHPPADADRRAGWLRRIALNAARRMRSTDRARKQREDAVARPEQTVGTDELVARVEMQRTVAQAVLRLDEPYRTVILLRFFEGLPPREIAERLNVPVETVRTRLKRAFARLREQLDGSYGTRDAWSAMLAPVLHGTGGAAAMSTGSKVFVTALVVVALGALTFEARRLTAGSRPELVASTTPLSATPPEQPPLVAEVDPAAQATRSAAEPAPTGVVAERVRFHGLVVDADTQSPVRGARVKVHCFTGGTVAVEAETSSLGDGTFELAVTGVTRQYYWADVTHPDYASRKIDPAAMPIGNAHEAVDVTVPTVELARGTLVSGRVVHLPDRTPVAGAEMFVNVRAEYVSPGQFGPDSARKCGRTRADGSFQLDQRITSEFGPLVILAVSAGRIGFVFLRPEHTRDRIDDLEVTIEQQGALAVRVLDDQGTPVANVALTAAPRFPPFTGPDWSRDPSQAPVITSEPWRAIFHATTDADGRARFPALPEGRVDALLSPFGHPQSYVIHAITPGWPDPRASVLIERGKESTLDIHLAAPCTHRIRGKISDEAGHPIAGALIRAEEFPETLSGEDGTYVTAELPGALGGTSIHVSAAGFAPDEIGSTRSWSRSHMVTLHDDPLKPACEVFEKDFTLARATNVRGRVVDEEGVPLAGVPVRATGLNPSRTNWIKLEAVGGKTDTEGHFLIEGVSVDNLALDVDPPDGYSKPFPVRIVQGDQHLLVRVLRQPKGDGKLLATVVDASTSEPLDPVSAYVRPVDSNQDHFAPPVRSLGKVQADNLTVGQWELVVKVNDGRSGRARFDIKDAHETVELKLSIAAQAIVEGTLLLGGEPVHPKPYDWFVWVRPDSNNSDDSGHALDADGRPVSGFTNGCSPVDENGRFRVGRLPAGVPIRFVVEGKETSADATVVLSPGEARKIEFHLQKSAMVEWSQAELLPPGRLVIEVAHGEEPLSFLFEAPTGQPGTTLTRERLGPGRMRWRARFTSSTEYPPRVLVATGEVELAPGETRIVDLVGFD